MRVVVSCAGRFHAFSLVEQLFLRGNLDRFITSTLNERLLPNRRLPDSVRDNPEFRSRIVTLPFAEYLGYGVRHFPFIGNQSASYLAKDNFYDQRAVRHIPNTDLFVGWASQSLFQLREAKTRGAKTIIERGSCHIDEQQQLIREECARFGAVVSMSTSKADELLREKQLKEYHETDYIMVPSEFARKSFLDRGFPEAKILKVRYGIDLSHFCPRDSREETTGPIRLLFVGAIGFQKGVPYLLESVAKLNAAGIRTHLTLIGRMESDFELWLKNSGFGQSINEHIPFVPNQELHSHFQRADLFVLPSVQEGLALVIAEAMACGLPVIASEHSGALEFITNGVNGVITPARSVESLVDSIRSLHDDPALRKQLGTSASESAKTFTWEHYGDEIVTEYRRVLNGRASLTTTQGEISEYYDTYWNRLSGWTPSHSFSDEQLHHHFQGAFASTDRVLDVGCGDASNYQSWLVGQVKQLSAIDISPSGIAKAKATGLTAQIHDLSKPFPFPDASFEGATCIEVLEHLYDPKFCVKEIARVLKPGGLLVTSVPNNGYIRERLRSLVKAELSTSITDFANEWEGAHIRFYSLHSFKRMLEVSGLKVESVRSNRDSSIFDVLDAFGGYFTQHFSTLLRRKLPRVARLAFLEDIWPSLFAPHIILRARKPGRQ